MSLRKSIICIGVFVLFNFVQIRSQEPRLVEFYYEEMSQCTGDLRPSPSKKLLPPEFKNDTLIAEFYLKGIPNTINYGVVENKNDTILLSIRANYNALLHHCRGGCYFKVKYVIKLYGKKKFVLHNTFNPFFGKVYRQYLEAFCNQQLEIENQIQNTVSIEKYNSFMDSAKYFSSKAEEVDKIKHPYTVKLLKLKCRRFLNRARYIHRLLNFMNSVDGFQIDVAKYNMSLYWHCENSYCRVEYVYY